MFGIGSAAVPQERVATPEELAAVIDAVRTLAEQATQERDRLLKQGRKPLDYESQLSKARANVQKWAELLARLDNQPPTD